MLDRRGFLKFIGGAAAGTLATPVIWKTIDDISIWSQNWPWIPSLDYGNNQNTYVRTVSKLCPSATGVKVRLVGDRPVRVLGDEENPLSRGGITAVAASEVQLRYSPARIKQPLKRSPDGVLVPISWQEAESILAKEFMKAKGQDKVLWLSGDENGSINELFSAFINKLGSKRLFVVPGEAQPTAVAWQLLGGRGRVGYDFANSDHVLAIGANVLESWGPVVANRRAWGDARPTAEAARMQLTFAGPVQNNTATGADTWLPIFPDTELVLVMGLLHGLVQSGKALSLGGLADLVAPWTPEKVSSVTGLPVEKLNATLEGLVNAKAPLVIVGSALDQGTSPANIMAGLLLNIVLGRLNKDGGVRILPVAGPVAPGAESYTSIMSRDFMTHALAVAHGKEKASSMLVFYEANPVYGLPGGAENKAMQALFDNAGFSVSFTSFLDETAAKCDLVIPAAFGLERHDDVCTPFGVGENMYALVRPVAKPLYEARPVGDVVLSLAAKMGITLGFDSMWAFYKAKITSLGATVADWERLRQGYAITSRSTLTGAGLFRNIDWQFLLNNAANRAAASAALHHADKRLALAVTVKSSLGNAKTAIPPFCTKTITNEQLNKNMLVANVNAATAKEAKLYNNSFIELGNDAGTIKAVVRINENVMDKTVALTAGFGHTAFSVFNAGKGMNALELYSAVVEPGTACAIWTNLGVRIGKA